MGVKELWSLLTPFCERKPLYELQGKTVAIDLACWVCEAMTVLDYSTQPRFYLRNLYFRTCFLLLMGVNPVFVLDGKAPELKYDTISQRTAIQFRGARPNTKLTKTGKDRSRFNSILKQCETLLESMGIKCVHGIGEAEATCAYLNKAGLVDGCISQDSDCFVYGAKVVYRNFSVSHQSSSGSVDVYELKNAQKSLDIGRNKMVALALLCGCDYNGEGVNGIGRDSALKFINQYSEENILNRLRSWSSNSKLFTELEAKVNNPLLCTSCGHDGKVQKHVRSGCQECKYSKGCNPELYRNERLLIKNELNIRQKALLDENFPNEELIEEFLNQKYNLPKLDLTWKQPNMVQLVMFMKKMIEWDELYAVEKFLPVLTRWQLLNWKYVQEEFIQKKSSISKGILFPDFIKKKRCPKGIPSYEIIWKDSENYFMDLIPTYQLKQYEEKSNDINILQTFWSTIEPKDLVENAYPELVSSFIESKQKKKVKKAIKNNKSKENRKVTKKKNISPAENLNESFDNLNISVHKTEDVAKKRRVDQELPQGNRKIYDFFVKQNSNVAEHVKNTSHTDFNESSISNFENENDLDLSSIVESVINRGFEVCNKYATTHLEWDCALENDHQDDRHNSYCDSEISYFFDNTCNEDVFEKMCNSAYVPNVSSEENDDSDNEYIQTGSTNLVSGGCDESFAINYIPLIERIKKKL